MSLVTSKLMPVGHHNSQQEQHTQQHESQLAARLREMKSMLPDYMLTALL